MEVVGAISAISSLVTNSVQLTKTVSSFVKQVKGAKAEIERLLRHVKSASVSLKQFEENLQQEKQLKLCFDSFYEDLSTTVEHCNDTFQKLDQTLKKAASSLARSSGSDQDTPWQRKLDELSWPSKRKEIISIQYSLIDIRKDLSDRSVTIVLAHLLHSERLARDQAALKDRKDKRAKAKLHEYWRKRRELFVLQEGLSKFQHTGDVNDVHDSMSELDPDPIPAIDNDGDTFPKIAHGFQTDRNQSTVNGKPETATNLPIDLAETMNPPPIPPVPPDPELQATVEDEKDIADDEGDLSHPPKAVAGAEQPTADDNFDLSDLDKDFAKKANVHAKSSNTDVQSTSDVTVVGSKTVEDPPERPKRISGLKSALRKSTNRPTDPIGRLPIRIQSPDIRSKQGTIGSRDSDVISSQDGRFNRPSSSVIAQVSATQSDSSKANNIDENAHVEMYDSFTIRRDGNEWHSYLTPLSQQELKAFAQDFCRKGKSVCDYSDRMERSLLAIIHCLLQTLSDTVDSAWNVVAVQIKPKRAKGKDIRTVQVILRKDAMSHQGMSPVVFLREHFMHPAAQYGGLHRHTVDPWPTGVSYPTPKSNSHGQTQPMQSASSSHGPPSTGRPAPLKSKGPPAPAPPPPRAGPPFASSHLPIPEGYPSRDRSEPDIYVPPAPNIHPGNIIPPPPSNQQGSAPYYNGPPPPLQHTNPPQHLASYYNASPPPAQYRVPPPVPAFNSSGLPMQRMNGQQGHLTYVGGHPSSPPRQQRPTFASDDDIIQIIDAPPKKPSSIAALPRADTFSDSSQTFSRSYRDSQTTAGSRSPQRRGSVSTYNGSRVHTIYSSDDYDGEGEDDDDFAPRDRTRRSSRTSRSSFRNRSRTSSARPRDQDVKDKREDRLEIARLANKLEALQDYVDAQSQTATVGRRSASSDATRRTPRLFVNSHVPEFKPERRRNTGVDFMVPAPSARHGSGEVSPGDTAKSEQGSALMAMQRRMPGVAATGKPMIPPALAEQLRKYTDVDFETDVDFSEPEVAPRKADIKSHERKDEDEQVLTGKDEVNGDGNMDESSS